MERYQKGGLGTGDLPVPERLDEINQRWADFYQEKKALLYRYAKGDEDLVSIGLLAVRKTLEEDPQTDIAWLVQRAKLTIKGQLRQRAQNGRVYLSFSTPRPFDEDGNNDPLQYEAMTSPLQRDPEIAVLDRIQFERMWDALSEMERKFLLILREEHILKTGHRWWGGKYAYTQNQRPKPKKRFRAEVSHSITDYYLSFANVRYHFFLNFGTDEEIEREKEWYASFDPQGRLHHKRDGRYEKK